MRLSSFLVLGLVLAGSATAQDHVPPTINPTATAVGRHRAVRPPSQPVIVSKSIVLTPLKDNTLYQTTDGSLSDGAGVHLFAGMTAGLQLRRALIAFDIAAQIPAGSTITRVTLVLHESQTVAGFEAVTLHGVTADWGQGSSNAGEARDGTGSPSQPGDATWIHTSFPNQRWSKPGGDFDAAVDATANVGLGDSTWGSSAAMIARVQDWLDHPSSNFGWIVIGNESTAQTSKRFDSREIATDFTRPRLTVDYNTLQ